MLRSVIFDMDGTLFQTDTILEIALEETFAYLRSQNKWDSETPLEKYREIMGVPLPKVWGNITAPLFQNGKRRNGYLFFGKINRKY